MLNKDCPLFLYLWLQKSQPTNGSLKRLNFEEGRWSQKRVSPPAWHVLFVAQGTPRKVHTRSAVALYRYSYTKYQSFHAHRKMLPCIPLAFILTTTKAYKTTFQGTDDTDPVQFSLEWNWESRGGWVVPHARTPPMWGWSQPLGEGLFSSEDPEGVMSSAVDVWDHIPLRICSCFREYQLVFICVDM